jgi:DNA-binding XRE family transcriptional regulator
MTNRKLKSLRAMHEEKQIDNAKFLAIDISTYNRKENGERAFTLNEAYKLAQKYNVSIEEIFFNQKDVI